MLKTLAITTCLAALALPAQASWLYCKFKPKDCTTIQGTLVPFDEAEGIIEDCRLFTHRSSGARALSMSFEDIMKIADGNRRHPLLLAQLAYGRLHDSALKFDRSIPIKQRYPHVKRACGQAFGDMD